MDTTNPTPQIVSVGYEQRDIDEFVELLQQCDVDLLIDVRLNAISRKPGFSKTALGDRLRDSGIDYRHERSLGNPKANRDGFRRGEAEARDIFVSHLHAQATQSLEAVRRLSEQVTVALMCYERDHATCHRSSIVEEVWPGEPAVSLIKI